MIRQRSKPNQEAIMLEARAKNFATLAHEGQTRKYTGEPYINHPAAVVELVRSVPHTPEMLAAAWLHDTVEDCGVDLREIHAVFGINVARLVEMLTDVSQPEDGNRAQRKAIDRAHTTRCSPDAATIKLADLIDNTRSIVERDPEFANVYLEEKRLLLEVLTHGNGSMWRAAVACAYPGETEGFKP